MEDENLSKHIGGCHCGKVKWEIEAQFDTVVSCNCSICSRRGHLLTFVAKDQFRLVSGEDALSDYQFHHKKIHHLFCKHCGIGSFGRGTSPDGQQMYSINVRCLDNIDLSTLQIHNFDGKSL